jgi:adenine-specific DNA glycosylase
VAFIVEHQGRVLVRQRPAGVVNAHLWEFPNAEAAAAGSRPEEMFVALFRRRSPALERLGLVRHTITRHRIALEGFRALADLALARRLAADKRGFRWTTRNGLGGLALPSAHRKLERLWVRTRDGAASDGEEK